MLQSACGGPVFHVTAVGMQSLHALIAGFILGGTTSFTDPGAVTLDPASGNYYVELALCVSDATGQPVAGDVLSIAFFDGAGNALGLVHATADARGCYSGDVQAGGAGSAVQPARLNLSDASGASMDLDVALGARLTRPPSGPLQSG